jgi:hypothetical protein
VSRGTSLSEKDQENDSSYLTRTSTKSHSDAGEWVSVFNKRDNLVCKKHNLDLVMSTLLALLKSNSTTEMNFAIKSADYSKKSHHQEP